MTESRFNSAPTALGLALLLVQPSVPMAADTSPSKFRSLLGVQAHTNPGIHPEAELLQPNMTSKAAALLQEMEGAGTLSPERVALARQALNLLALWQAPQPTELSDGSDGDFSLIWRKPGLAASLTYTDDEVIGYAYSPKMFEPWMFEQDRIGISELNTLRRALG